MVSQFMNMLFLFYKTCPCHDWHTTSCAKWTLFGSNLMRQPKITSRRIFTTIYQPLAAKETLGQVKKCPSHLSYRPSLGLSLVQHYGPSIHSLILFSGLKMSWPVSPFGSSDQICISLSFSFGFSCEGVGYGQTRFDT